MFGGLFTCWRVVGDTENSAVCLLCSRISSRDLGVHECFEYLIKVCTLGQVIVVVDDRCVLGDDVVDYWRRHFSRHYTDIDSRLRLG